MPCCAIYLRHSRRLPVQPVLASVRPPARPWVISTSRHLEADLPTCLVDALSTSCAHTARAHALERAGRFERPIPFHTFALPRSGYVHAAHLVRESAALSAALRGMHSLRCPPASKWRHSKGAGRRTRTPAWSCGDRSRRDRWEDGDEWPWTMSHAAAPTPPCARAHGRSGLPP